jgi:hypothetical protein
MIIAFAASIMLSSCAPSGTAVKGEGSPVPGDDLMGDWRGHRVTATGVVVPLAVQVIALGGGSYRFVTVTSSRQPDLSLGSFDVVREDNRLLVASKPDWQVAYANGVITGLTSADEAVNFALTHSRQLSPSLGAKPPAGAVILFDGKTLDAWQARDVNRRGAPAGWNTTGGVMEVKPGTGDLITKRSFTDVQLHLEFRTPFLPEAREQARGNSGVYLQGRYEVQVLDSYGLKGEDNECGGIYKVAAPRVNMCAPPGQWQSYDITFHAPRFDTNKSKIKNAVVTVVHNGIVVHENLLVPGPTGGAIDNEVQIPAGLLLQDHGNLVQYRNIWLVELKD